MVFLKYSGWSLSRSKARFGLVIRSKVSLLKQLFLRYAMVIALPILVQIPLSVQAQTTVNIADTPLLALKSAPGLVMLNMSRDHRLFYAAYNDTSDIDGDGIFDVGFKPSINYYGYFVSDRCYKYDSAASPARFVPVAVVDSVTGCSAVSTARWHGNWMNWMATSRIDALRKVLYGGLRKLDNNTATVLEAAHIPPDSHIWGKEFRPSPKGTDSYLIQNYTPMPAPGAGKMHIFLMKSEGSAATQYLNLSPPTLRAIQDVDIDIDRVWLWASSERPVGGAAGTTGYNRPANGGRVTNQSPAAISYGLPGFSSGGTSYSATSFNAFITPPTIRVEACVAIGGKREEGCTGYPDATPTYWKPTGVLHDYSSKDSLKFGLITGSYLKNYSGGVLRKDIESFKDEVNAANGQFNAAVGIVKTIDRISNYGFEIGSQTYTCGNKRSSLRNEGECLMWGSPVAEMMYEGLRYFTDKQPTPEFVSNVGVSTSPDTRLGLPTKTTWKNPYASSPVCSKPVQMVIADPITSFDSDQLPGAAYTPDSGNGGAITPDLAGLNVSDQADQIWIKEFGTTVTKNFFIGQSSTANSDGNPTSKPAASFKLMRGHAPDETATQGSYYAASVAKFGRETGVPTRSSSTGTVTVAKVDQISVALGSVVPRIELVYASKTVSLVPFSKMVGGCSQPTPPASTASGFQPTGLITGVFIDRIANSPVSTEPLINSGRPFARFMVSFSDMDQGGDNEADANVYYTMAIDALGKLEVRIDSYYQATCAQQNMGYVISGTTNDGVYLEVRGVSAGSDVYYLDTRPGQSPTPVTGRSPANTFPISNSFATRTFTLTAAAGSASYVPKDPLWYAAKYGGAGLLDVKGDPTNYFRVTNPSELPAQLGKAFRAAAALAAVSNTSVTGASQQSPGSAAVYQANYDSITWSSRIYSFAVSTAGDISNTPTWEASAKLPALNARNLFLGRGLTSTLALTTSAYTSLNAVEKADFGTTATFAYLLGDKSQEERFGGKLRNRGAVLNTESGSVIGDIVNSDPKLILKEDFGYAAGDTDYAAFLAQTNFEMLAVGTNGGYFHIFDAAADATGGKELLGFMPQAARDNIKQLSNPNYLHRNFVDGPVVFGHAKIGTNWRSITVGTGGVGAATVFAIDTTTKTFTASSILWELNINTLPSAYSTTFGKIVGKPVIGKLANGTWAVIFGNGYNSTSGLAKLYVVDLATGAVIKVLDAGSLTGNGMGSIESVRKTTGDKDTIEFVYGTDYKGAIWRFDLTGTAATWSGKTTLVFRTPSDRPITAELRVGAPPTSANTSTSGKMIYFGTGQFLDSSDTNTTKTQALYGIYDDTTTPSTNLEFFSGGNPSPLVAGSQLAVMSISMTADASLRSTTAVTTPWYAGTTQRGWTIPLTGTNVPAGERVIAPPLFYSLGVNNAIIFTSMVPGTDPCAAGVFTWQTGVDALTGGYSKVYANTGENSIRVAGGSPRGAFVLNIGARSFLISSYTVFGGVGGFPSGVGSNGGQTSNTVGPNQGGTGIGNSELTRKSDPVTTGATRQQIWKQLK